MRVFLAVTPDPDTSRAIDAWRHQCWPVISRAIPPQNYHITLAFLGDVSSKQVALLGELVADLAVSPFNLPLNDVGFWPDARCLWLGPKPASTSSGGIGFEPIQQLASRCVTIANRVGVRTGKKTFSPHLTLARSVDTPPSQAMINPEFQLDVVSVELYQSLRERTGARYIELESWALPQPK